jgi:hypothetical protein
LYEKVFDVPVEEHGITYMGIDVPEMEPTGPAAFVVASDGSFYIADTVGGRVLHYSPKGDRLSIITPSEQVVGIADLAVIDSDVVVLDVAAMVPRVLRCSPDGKVVVSYDLPEGLRPENGLSGIAVGDNGEVRSCRYRRLGIRDALTASGDRGLLASPFIRRGTRAIQRCA